jgi:hypothetical protein
MVSSPRSGSGAESAAAPADIEICPISVVY